MLDILRDVDSRCTCMGLKLITYHLAEVQNIRNEVENNYKYNNLFWDNSPCWTLYIGSTFLVLRVVICVSIF